MNAKVLRCSMPPCPSALTKKFITVEVVFILSSINSSYLIVSCLSPAEGSEKVDNSLAPKSTWTPGFLTSTRESESEVIVCLFSASVDRIQLS